jgi:hypothetical protein
MSDAPETVTGSAWDDELDADLLMMWMVELSHPDPNTTVVAALEVTAEQRGWRPVDAHQVILGRLFGRFNPDLHPRGRDGQFIENGGDVELVDFSGLKNHHPELEHARGQVVGIEPDPQSPGAPNIRVRLKDGNEVTVKPRNVNMAPEAKARLDQHRSLADRLFGTPEERQARGQASEERFAQRTAEAEARQGNPPPLDDFRREELTLAALRDDEGANAALADYGPDGEAVQARVESIRTTARDWATGGLADPDIASLNMTPAERAWFDDYSARYKTEVLDDYQQRLDSGLGWGRAGQPESTPPPEISPMQQAYIERRPLPSPDRSGRELPADPEAEARRVSAESEREARRMSTAEVMAPSTPTTGPQNIPGIGDVDAYIASIPKRPDETDSQWEARMINGLTPDQQNAITFQIRERYEAVDFISSGMTRYRQEHNLPEPQVNLTDIPVPRANAQLVADAFEQAPDMADDPRVQAVFTEFKRQNAEMWDFATKPESEGGLGISVDFWTNPNPAEFGVGPYQTAGEQADDLRNNHHISIEHGLGGAHGMTMTEQEYDRFRAVHDIFGHAGVGAGFDRHGEYQAYLAHSSMYIDDGRIGMASEYHGVNTSLWAGNPESAGTGKSVVLPENLIPNPFSPTGELITAAAMIPTPDQLAALNIDQETADGLAYLADQTGMDHLTAQYYDSPILDFPNPPPGPKPREQEAAA